MEPHLTIRAPLPPAVHLRRPRAVLPYPLQEDGCRIVAWARHGLYLGVKQLGLGPGDAVLMPAYHHGSEVQALLEAGVACRFYDGDERLAPDPDELERALDEHVRALYLIHTIGFPQDTTRWRAWCDERGLLLIEDAAQAWLATDAGRPVGSVGDLAFFCLYKTFGLPEGAAVIQRSPAEPVPIDPRWGLMPMLRRHGAWVAGRSGLVWELRRRTRRAPEVVADGDTGDFSLRDPTVGPWSHTPYLLSRIADPAAAARRREHYAMLLERLGELVPPPFEVLPAGASPFVFPIVPPDEARLHAHAEAAGVTVLELWRNAHPLVPIDDFPRSRKRRATVVGLPVHQELRERDVRRIADVVEAAAGRSAPAAGS